MFQALEPLIRSAGTLTLSLAMDGDNVVVFLTPQGGKDATLRQPLILKAPAAELDEGFAAAVTSYSTAHKSLEEQVAATNAILDEQKATEVTKAQKALTKGSKVPTAGAAGGANDDDNDDDGDQPAPSVLQDSVAESKPAGTDLASLLI
ncbi:MULTISPECIES: PRTRC system protein E [unclassified Burkholderia]|uniref:PRTRC system protein E n=1 Tax=unclassified Burkholderia TaxID=2613784 RepID=UPI00215032B2|nr:MULTISPECIES: PRTRC system protein E [unclassified Burkholderia]MCR4469873.1 PRTRC system protein E [Burkholderia sp. SCN-KJ]